MTPDVPPSPAAPSMEDVARAAGVHQTTVSRALRNDPRITESVKQKVREAAERLGYRPNPLLSALGTLRRQRASSCYQASLAYIVKDGASGMHVVGAQAAAEQRGYKVEIFGIGKELTENRLNGILVARGIQGIIIGPLPEAHGQFSLEWERYSTVVIEYSFTNPAFDRVVTNSFDTMNMTIRECRARGYRRLGVALMQVVDERNEGLLCASYALAQTRDPGLERLKPLIVPAWDKRAFLAWFKRERPEVVISSNFFLPHIEACLEELGLESPRDVGLVNLNRYPDNPRYTGVCQDAPAIGAMAARLAIEKLNHNERGIPSARMTMLTDGRWVEGETLRSPVTSGSPRGAR